MGHLSGQKFVEKHDKEAVVVLGAAWPANQEDVIVGNKVPAAGGKLLSKPIENKLQV